MTSLQVGLMALVAIILFKTAPNMMNGVLFKSGQSQSGTSTIRVVKKPCPYANKQPNYQQGAYDDQYDGQEDY